MSYQRLKATRAIAKICTCQDQCLKLHAQFFGGVFLGFFGGNRVCVKNDKCYFAVLEMKGDG